MRITDRTKSQVLLSESITVVPQRNSTLYIRAWICDENYQNCLRFPSGTSQKDQQEHSVYRETIRVSETEPPPPPEPECRLSNVNVSPSSLTVLEGESDELSARVNFSPSGCARERDVSFEWSDVNGLGSFSGDTNSSLVSYSARKTGEGQVVLTASYGGDERTISIQIAVHNPAAVDIRIESDKFYDFEKIPQAVANRAICTGRGNCIFMLAGDSATLYGRVSGLPGVANPRWQIEVDPPNSVAQLSTTNQFQTELQTSPQISEITEITVRFGLDSGNSRVADKLITIVVVPVALGVKLGSCSASLYESGNEYYVLTAEHCVTKYDEQVLKVNGWAEVLIGKVTYQASLVGIDQATDLAVFKVEGYRNPNQIHLPRLDFGVSRGSTVYAVGYPALPGWVGERGLVVTSSKVNKTTSCGYTRSLRKSKDSKNRQEIDNIISDSSVLDGCLNDRIETRPGFISGGNSGGPVVDETGLIVGIASATAENHSFSVLSFFSDQRALNRFLSGNLLRCFKNVNLYTEGEPIDTRVGSCEESSNIVVNRNRTNPVLVNVSGDGVFDNIIDLPVYDDSPVTYTPEPVIVPPKPEPVAVVPPELVVIEGSSGTSWWVYTVSVAAALFVIILIRLRFMAIARRKRRRRRELP